MTRARFPGLVVAMVVAASAVHAGPIHVMLYRWAPNVNVHDYGVEVENVDARHYRIELAYTVWDTVRGTCTNITPALPCSTDSQCEFVLPGSTCIFHPDSCGEETRCEFIVDKFVELAPGQCHYDTGQYPCPEPPGGGPAACDNSSCTCTDCFCSVFRKAMVLITHHRSNAEDPWIAYDPPLLVCYGQGAPELQGVPGCPVYNYCTTCTEPGHCT